MPERGHAEGGSDLPDTGHVANVDAEPYPDSDGDEVRQRLRRQVAGTVRWEGCVHKLAALGAAAAIEVGPGRVLSGLIKRIAPTIATHQFAAPDDLENLRSLGAAQPAASYEECHERNPAL